MRNLLRWLFAVTLLLCTPVLAKTKTSVKSSDPVMTVVIVRDSAPECEPVCPQWIAAEGRITNATPAAFKKALAAAGETKLPVLIQSSGGDVRAALEIGRMIRKQKFDVAVGWTAYRDGCNPTQADCKLPPAQKGIFHGTAIHNRAYCNSACPLILASGVKRLAGWGTYVGVHQVTTVWVKGDRITYRESYRMVRGKRHVVKRTVVSRTKGKSYTTNGLYKGLRVQLTAYLNEMGVDLGLFVDMEKAPPSSIYWMPAAEMEKLKLVTGPEMADDLTARAQCKRYPLPTHCIFLIPSEAKS
jgi:hypothetical protein